VKNVVKNALEIIRQIRRETKKWNMDNISRTVFYHHYYQRNPEIKWAFLASMVSRNAGWSMCDLQGEWFPKALTKKQLINFFMTYERANWTIFDDAAPQLMLYEVSKRRNKSFFELGQKLGISDFILQEWEKFFQTGDEERLMTALIINEQHVIEAPVMEHHTYAKEVFHSFFFTIQDWFHFSTVLFPTMSGELYGLSVSRFRHTKDRIELGKKLAKLLFHPTHFDEFYRFATNTYPTGARFDYERYMNKKREGKMLRQVYPLIHHHRKERRDWYHGQSLVKKMLNNEITLPAELALSDWYEKKRSEIRVAVEIENLLIKKSRR
jgi:hypothetical protein